MILTEQQKREQLAEQLRKIHETEERKRQPDERFQPSSVGSHLRIDEIYNLPSTYDEAGQEVKGRSMARCTCRCGNKVEYPLSFVVRKAKTHCGCRKINIIGRAEQEYPQKQTLGKNVIDITGKEFGYLFVESYAGTIILGINELRRSAWNVRCACGCVMVLDPARIAKRKQLHCGSKICKRLYDEGKTRAQAKALIGALIERDYAMKQVVLRKQAEFDKIRANVTKNTERRHKWKDMIGK